MSLSRPLPDPGKGLRFLSFDGGGIRAISQALMVKEMMDRIEAKYQLSNPPRVCDYFDMICGSGFGGILAIMCGILKMTGYQLVLEFVKLCKAVFSEGLDTTQRTTVLEREMKRMIGNYSTEGEERTMFSKDDPCKTFVCAAAFHNTGHPRLFRNYRARANPSIDCMLWEAACATASMPDLFEPIVIGDMNIGEMFVGGDLRWNNPTNELTREAADVFKNRRICSIINIGSGHSGHMSLSKGLADLFPRIALDCERVADDMERRFWKMPEVFWRLNVEQGLQSLVVELSNLDALVSHTHSYLQSARTTRNIDALLQDLIQRPERIPVDRISGEALVALEVLRRKLCPPPTQYFTGRRTDLKKLEEYFSLNRKPTSCRIAVLYGIGGGGKSQMGLEFVRQSQERFAEVVFIDASDKFTLENDLKTIAIGVSDEPTVEDALHLLRTTKEEWLLFLDNADDPSLDLGPYIMWPHGNVLITTRNHEVRVHAPDCNIWVDKLDLDDAVELLLRGVAAERTPETYEIATEIVQTLGCLALAVNQARGFLAQDICTLSEYLHIYMENRQTLLEDKLIQSTDDYRHTVYTTWTMSFNKLSSLATELLEFLCFMHHESIPSRIFEDARKFCTDDEDAVPTSLVNFLSSFEAAGSTWDILRFRMLVKEILSFSLIEFNPGNRTFSVHPLVQQVAQNQCLHSQQVIRSTQTLLSLATPIGETKEDIVMTLSLLPHLRASSQTGHDVYFTLLRFLGLIYQRGGMFEECVAVHKEEKSMVETEFGQEHPDTLRTMENLAHIHSKLGQHQDALKLQERVLELSPRIRGVESMYTLACMSDLAATYSALGQHTYALKLGQQALDLRTSNLGEDHPHTLTSLSNLAATYSDLGDHRNALKLEEQALELRRDVLGKEHPHTLQSMNNLASIYSKLGQHGDALELKEQVLELRTKILGKEHPDTLESMNNLASTYLDLGQPDDALKLSEQVVEFSVKNLQAEHPLTLTSMNNLALTYSYLERHEDALTLHEHVLELSIRIQGKDHPVTLQSMGNVARTYSDLGQHSNALRLMEQVLELRTYSQGEKHPDTLTSMGNLALTYSELGQHNDALKLHEQALELRTQILGEEHPDTLASMDNLAAIYSELGRHRDALKSQERALALRSQILGEEHPETLQNMNNLAVTYAELGQFSDALKLHEQTLELRTNILGDEHPGTLESMYNLAGTLSELDRPNDALKLEERVLELRMQVLGEEDPDTLTSMNNLAATYSELGRHSDALELHEQTLSMRRRVLGSEHPDTALSAMWIEELRDKMANAEPRRVLGKRKRLED
ncbi:hypothetical protein DL96DRAFT_1764564 [Flagelloscypha sp. PMI_526]|nr:hypothetical protein DL96DRAFT_1764564 [Flagelloscypha sp. PMI_526]